MGLPQGKLSGDQITNLFDAANDHHLQSYTEFLSQFKTLDLFSCWRTLVRSVDEMINIPFVLSNSDMEKFLTLRIDFLNPSYQQSQLTYILKILEEKFGQNVSIRFLQLAQMCSANKVAYDLNGNSTLYLNGNQLSNISECISFLQSKRAYYMATLNLIPKIARGTKSFEYLDTFNQIHYSMDACLTEITNGYIHLLINSCLDDYEVFSNGNVAHGNFEYNHLENFYFEPERLSLLDQMELRSDIVEIEELSPLPSNSILSFTEVTNTLKLFKGAFKKYKIDDKKIFSEIERFISDLIPYLVDDYHVQIKRDSFKKLKRKYKNLKLHSASKDYYDNLNDFYPFQFIAKKYFSTVALVCKFIYQSLSRSLLPNRSFQINSGFVFEDKARAILVAKGYQCTDIKRINHKEFDLVTIKDGKVHNFQCKNNIYDVAEVTSNYKKTAAQNKRLCNSYEKALLKEENRESLIKDETGIDDISHYVVSRFPVITRNSRIINFNNLKSWAPDE